MSPRWKTFATHVWQLGAVETVEPQLVVARSVIDRDSPIGKLRPLVIVGNDVGDGRTGVLNLYSTVGSKGRERDRAIVVQTVCAVLPPDNGLDTRWVGGIGFVSVVGLLKVSVIGAGR